MIHQKAATTLTERHEPERRAIKIDDVRTDSLAKTDESTFL